MQDLYRTGCGGVMVVPPKTKDHLIAHPEVGKVIEEAMQRLLLPGDGSFMVTDVDFGRVIGRSGLVATDVVGWDEPTTFALRTARARASRVAVGAEGPESSLLAVIAFAASDRRSGQVIPGRYVLVTAFCGGVSPQEPWDPHLAPEDTNASRTFWCANALVYDPKVMGGTFTSTWRQVCEG
jgi:hypothetical protein